jgi:hypothetical protein
MGHYASEIDDNYGRESRITLNNDSFIENSLVIGSVWCLLCGCIVAKRLTDTHRRTCKKEN